MYADVRPWRADTIVGVYSTTKTMAVLAALLVADRGELDFAAPVARYWPEFAAAGKADVTVAQVMSHSSGLRGWRLRLQESVDIAATPEASSPAASLGLTQREAKVLALVAEGRTNRQIGQALFIIPKTTSVHVSRIRAKLGAAGRGEAAATAHRLGLDKQ